MTFLPGFRRVFNGLRAYPSGLGVRVVVLAVLMAAPGLGKVQTTSTPATPQVSTPQRSPAPPQKAAGEPVHASSRRNLAVIVEDETGVAVPHAHVVLEPAAGTPLLREETDYAGQCEFDGIAPGHYQLRVEKEGFFAFAEKDLDATALESVHVTLNHQQEFVEHVTVTYSPPHIDPTQTPASTTLDSQQIIDLPFNVTRDIRYALPMLPQVVQDGTGQVHVAGAATRQTADRIDGFNVDTPVGGSFTMRVNVDAIRSVEVEESRYSAEFGKASGGVVNLATGMGDDTFRYSATDFAPSIQHRKGFHINTWTPRGTFSGPLKEGKAWFLLAPEGEYNLDIIPELPQGQDRSSSWRFGNLAKAQVNLPGGNILTASALLNDLHFTHAGLDRFDPLPTTINVHQPANLYSLKDQLLLPRGALVEFGVAFSHFHSDVFPMGNQPYFITPEGTSGNYFETARGQSSRVQGIVNAFLPPVHAAGRHEFKVGLDLTRLTDRQAYVRNSVSILREDGTLARRIVFSPANAFVRDSAEAGAYAQDRWSPRERWLVEAGARLDWDEIVRQALVSPRLAVTFVPTHKATTKLVAGIGVYYDRSNLDYVTRPDGGQRTDYFYDSTGTILTQPPLQTTFQVNERQLVAPRFINWSLGVEQRMPGHVYFRTGYIRKRERHGWAFVPLPPATPGTLSGQSVLQTIRRDRYDGVEFTARKPLARGHYLFASYVRSSSRTNAVLDFNLENPVFSPQAAGPLPWDSPNRFISWGKLPLVRGFDFAYTLDWRQGFPFSIVNEDQELVGNPGSHRFPTYFTLNAAVERRLTVFGLQWALRAGIDNVTDNQNPSVVDNNIDSPHFLTFGGIATRALTARIRLLGKK